MADYRRHYDEEPRRPETEWSASAYRTDDRGYHDRFRGEARTPAVEFEDGLGLGIGESAPLWARRERGGYWRNYAPQGTFAGRGPKGYQRSDERVREEICDCMTDDPMLGASEITVVVSNGEVVLSGTVTSRDQKRRAEDVAERISGVKDVTSQLRVSREANGHNHAAPPLVTQASGKGTPSNSASGTTT